MINKLKNVLFTEDDDETNDEVIIDDKRRTNKETNISNSNISNSENSKVILFEPRNYTDSEVIAKTIKLNCSAMVNLGKLNPNDKIRTLDFLQGVVYALDGTVSTVAENAVLFTPYTVSVDGEITLSKDQE